VGLSPWSLKWACKIVLLVSLVPYGHSGCGQYWGLGAGGVTAAFLSCSPFEKTAPTLVFEGHALRWGDEGEEEAEVVVVEEEKEAAAAVVCT
jgi:hypothetical protein